MLQVGNNICGLHKITQLLTGLRQVPLYCILLRVGKPRQELQAHAYQS